MSVDVSKQAAYAVLVGTTLDVSKQAAYAVLRQSNTIDVSKQAAYAVLLSVPTGDLRLPFIGAEPITGGNPNVRLPFIGVEPLTGGNPNIRLPYVGVEPLTGGNPNIRCPLIGLEVFYALPEEKPVATDVFPSRIEYSAPLVTPGLPGLRWSRRKKPEFRTKKDSSVGGRELRTAFMNYPIWNFELEFEYLDGRDDAGQIERMMGFFLTQKGAFQEWLFHDWDDYEADGQFLGVADGGTTGYTLMRTLGGFVEPIGQVDNADLFEFDEMDINVGSNTVTVTDHGLSTGFGPVQLTTSGTPPGGLAVLTNYWIISLSANTLRFAASEADALAGTPVTITDDGMGTFMISNSIAVYVDSMEVPPSDYTVDVNEIIFDTAPMSGNVSWTGKYYFVCSFLDDIADFAEFQNKLWTLETIEFKSIPGLVTQNS